MPSSKFILVWVAGIFLLQQIALASQLEEYPSATCSYTAITPTPTSYVCGTAGSLSHSSALNTTKTRTYQACQDLCLGSSKCKVFSYGPGKNCIAYSKTAAKMGFKAGNTKKRFWNKSCFKKECGLCPPGLTDCSGRCFNTSSNTGTCGSCGYQCIGSQQCVAGKCTVDCGPYPVCAGNCVDFQNDPFNCGACYNMCNTDNNEYCIEGKCTVQCQPQTNCNGTCVDTDSDPKNCGACNAACPSEGDSCVKGRCGQACPKPGTCKSPASCPSQQTSDGSECYCRDVNGDLSGNGICGRTFVCSAYAECASSDDCGAGAFCSSKSCCKEPRCIPYSITCGNPANPATVFQISQMKGKLLTSEG